MSRKSKKIFQNSPTTQAATEREAEIKFEETFHKMSSENSPSKYPVPTDRPVRIYCDGIYDLFHYGHARSLEQAKKLFPSVHLIVGVCNDEVTHSKKGMTVFSDIERAESIRHCKWVDEVIENAPWVITQEFLDAHQIDFVAHDDIPYVSGDCKDVYQFVKDQGRFLATKRTEGVSTSGIITRIVHDYDIYVRRNLERGVSPKELNLSFLKLSEIQVKHSVRRLSGQLQGRLEEEEQNIRRNWESTKDELQGALAAWEAKSHDFIKGFVNLFQDRQRSLIKKFRLNKSRQEANTAGGGAQM